MWLDCKCTLAAPCPGKGCQCFAIPYYRINGNICNCYFGPRKPIDSKTLWTSPRSPDGRLFTVNTEVSDTTRELLKGSEPLWEYHQHHQRRDWSNLPWWPGTVHEKTPTALGLTNTDEPATSSIAPPRSPPGLHRAEPRYAEAGSYLEYRPGTFGTPSAGPSRPKVPQRAVPCHITLTLRKTADESGVQSSTPGPVNNSTALQPSSSREREQCVLPVAKARESSKVRGKRPMRH